MYIRTDDDNNIVELIIVGARPKVNGYEIDSIDESILKDILNYKYINGEFIKSDTDIRDKYIDTIRDIKISRMSQVCNALIEHGIDFGGSHYSLTTTDQINLIKLESMAKLSPETTILYHADGEDCRVYSNEEITSIAELAMAWITYNTTYFNQLKSQINETNSIDEIISINYGSTLDETHNEQFMGLTQGLTGLGLSINEITDEFDYESIIPKVHDEVVYDALNPNETNETSTDDSIQITEEWKENTEVFVPEEDTTEDVEEFPSLPDESNEETGVDESVVENEPVEEIIEEEIIIDEPSNVSDGKSVYTPAEDNGIPDTSTEVEWEEEVSEEEIIPTNDETDENNGGYQPEEIIEGSDSVIKDETIIEESEEITDEETGTELPV